MKANLIALLTLLSLSLVLPSCKSGEIVNGEVPNQYLPEAKKLEGVYHGKFNGVSGALTISFEGNRPVVTYKNKKGTDLLNNNCNSQIGLLREVEVQNQNGNMQITSAVFDFNPGSCSKEIAGRHLRIAIKESNDNPALTLGVVETATGRPYCGIRGPDSVCEIHYDYTYLYGNFAR